MDQPRGWWFEPLKEQCDFESDNNYRAYALFPQAVFMANAACFAFIDFFAFIAVKISCTIGNRWSHDISVSRISRGW